MCSVERVKGNLKLILKYAKLHKGRFLILYTCIIVTTFSGAFYPYIFGRLVDEVFYAKNMSKFINIVLIYGLVFLFNQIMHFVLNITWAKLMTRFLFDIRKDIYNKGLSYKGKTLSSMYSGDIISRMGNDTEQFMNFIHWNVFYTTGGLLNLFLSFGFIAYISWRLAILIIVLTPISVYVSRYFAKKVKVFYGDISSKNGILSSWIFEIINGMHEIRLLCAAKNVICDYNRRTIEIMRLQIKASAIAGNMVSINRVKKVLEEESEEFNEG